MLFFNLTVKKSFALKDVLSVLKMYQNTHVYSVLVYKYDVGTYEPQSELIYLYHEDFLEVQGFVAASVAALGSLRVSKGSGVDVRSSCCALR